MWWRGILYLVVCYFLGAIPSAYLVCRFLKGVDLRTVGSKNVGATNCFRVAGPVPTIFVTVFDMGKGFAAVMLARGFGLSEPMPIFGGLVAVAGHVWPIWLGFRGGKAVLTGAGVFFALAWLPSLIAVASGVTVIAVTRYVSLGSITGAVVLPISLIVLSVTMRFRASIGVQVLGVMVGLLVIVLHHSNIKRLLGGAERKIGQKVDGTE